MVMQNLPANTSMEQNMDSGHNEIRESARVATIDSEKREVVIDVIEAGLGNSRDRRLYETEMLSQSPDVFIGAQMFADHLPPEVERKMQGLPRSVRDLTGSIKEAWWQPNGGPSGNGSIQARVKIAAPWLWDLVKNDPELVGVSINAVGRTRPGVGPDGKPAHMVESITHCHSVDWVAQAGAGGRIVGFLESHYGQGDMEVSIDWEAVSKEDIAEHRPDLVDAFEADVFNTLEELEASLMAEIEAEANEQETEPVAEESAEGETPEAADEDEDVPSSRDDDENDADDVTSDEPELVGVAENEFFTYDEVKEIVLEAAQAIEAKYEARERVRENRLIAHDVLAESGLPVLSQQAIRKTFQDFESNADELRESLKESIKEKRAELSSVTGRGVQGLGPSLLMEAEGGDDGEKDQPVSQAGAHTALLSELGLD
jgi:hypothetical protein